MCIRDSPLPPRQRPAAQQRRCPARARRPRWIQQRAGCAIRKTPRPAERGRIKCTGRRASGCLLYTSDAADDM
eukprot:13087531-Alexandrium_andersonii.AAC.1